MTRAVKLARNVRRSIYPHGLDDPAQDSLRELERMAADAEALAEALEFYADPMTYFGIAMFGDAPHGDFFDDFEEYPIPGQLDLKDKPGKRARAALARYRGEKP